MWGNLISGNLNYMNNEDHQPQWGAFAIRFVFAGILSWVTLWVAAWPINIFAFVAFTERSYAQTSFIYVSYAVVIFVVSFLTFYLLPNRGGIRVIGGRRIVLSLLSAVTVLGFFVVPYQIFLYQQKLDLDKAMTEGEIYLNTPIGCSILANKNFVHKGESVEISWKSNGPVEWMESRGPSAWTESKAYYLNAENKSPYKIPTQGTTMITITDTKTFTHVVHGMDHEGEAECSVEVVVQ